MNSKKSIREWVHTGLLTVCATSLVIIAVLLWNLPQVLQTAPTESNSATSDTAPSSTADMKSIETTYGSVQFPLKWAEYLEYEELKTDNGVEYVFYCRLADEKIELYRVAFGEPQADNFAGYLERDGDRIPVSMQSSEIPVDGFSEDDVEILQSMSGTYNDVLISISGWDGFVYE